MELERKDIVRNLLILAELEKKGMVTKPPEENRPIWGEVRAPSWGRGPSPESDFIHVDEATSPDALKFDHPRVLNFHGRSYALKLHRFDGDTRVYVVRACPPTRLKKRHAWGARKATPQQTKDILVLVETVAKNFGLKGKSLLKPRGESAQELEARAVLKYFLVNVMRCSSFVTSQLFRTPRRTISRGYFVRAFERVKEKHPEKVARISEEFYRATSYKRKDGRVSLKRCCKI